MFDSTIDFFTILLFESPARLLLAALIGGAVLGYLYHREPGPKYGRAIVALIALTGAMMIVQQVVVTDRERVHRLMEDMANAVEQGNANFIVNSLDPQYSGQGFNRQTSALTIRVALGRYKVSILRLSVGTIKMRPKAKSAELEVGSLSDVTRGGVRHGALSSVWHLEFRKRPNGWKVSNIRPIRFGNRSVESIGEIP